MPNGAQPVTILLPWWYDLYTDTSVFNGMDRYLVYARTGQTYFEFTDEPQLCDIAVLPADWKFYLRTGTMSLAHAFIQIAKDHNKRVLIQFFSDDDDSIDVKDAIVLRTSSNSSKPARNEFTLPAFVGDPIAMYRNGLLPVREKTEAPHASFCGWVEDQVLDEDAFHSIVKNAFNGIDLQTKSKLVYSFRKRVLDYLQVDPRIKRTFTLRAGYAGNINRQDNPHAFERLRREYYESIFKADYVVCIRGKGNYSYRFYETLACGRIPIFVNTDSPLPFPDMINWKRHCVWVEHTKVPDICEIVNDFHRKISRVEFIELQKANRALWENWLTPEGFFRTLKPSLKDPMS